MSPYLAPEVSSGNLPSPSSDVYSVGILLYQLLSGRFPYSADTPVAMALKHATAGIPSVKIYNSAVPNALDEIVKKAMAKDPAVRYANASELLSDLRMLQDGLRFGKTLTWPLKTAPSPEKQPVAPKMSAIREEEAERAKKEREPRDVPIWLIAVFAFFAAVFLAAIGYFLIYNVSKPKWWSCRTSREPNWQKPRRPSRRSI
jgi:serine/threonine-protein kinase